MKSILSILVFMSVALSSSAQKKEVAISTPDPAKEVLIVEASCGQCKFGLKAKDCDLAIRTKGKAYFVDGTKIDDHGDAHASDGFCEAIRKAKVQGEIKDGRFKATYFELLPEEKKTN